MDKKQENIELLQSALKSLNEMTDMVHVLLNKVVEDTAKLEEVSETDFTVCSIFNSLPEGVYHSLRQVHANYTIGTHYEWVYWHRENGILVPGEDKERKSIFFPFKETSD